MACRAHAEPAACIRGTPRPRGRAHVAVPRKLPNAGALPGPSPCRGTAHGSACVQRRLTCSAGASPAGARARRPVAWMAGGRETELLKPIDEAIRRMVSESPGRNVSERGGSLESAEPRRPSAYRAREGNMGRRSLADAADPLRRGGSDSTVTRTRQATGEALLVPPRNRRKGVCPITSAPGKWVDDERVAEGPAVAMRRGNARGAKGPCCSVTPPATRKAGAS
jgi:hypothetical protein